MMRHERTKLHMENTHIMIASVSFFVFYMLNIPATMVIVIILLSNIFFSNIFYHKEKNEKAYGQFYGYLWIICAVYILTRCCKMFLDRTVIWNWSEILSIVKSAVMLFLCLFFFIKHHKLIVGSEKNVKSEANANVQNAQDGQEESDLFEERQYDLERIKRYLHEYDRIGINAGWGSGKTFLMTQLRAQCSSEFVFVRIPLLACNLDDIQGVIADAIDQVLTQEGIFSKYSRQLRRLFSTQKLRWLADWMLPEQSSYFQIMDGLKLAFQKLDRPLVIIFEDIDRIGNVEEIQKVFSISEHLAAPQCKIVFEYYETNLQQRAALFDRSYTEKYIPFTVNLTPISFQRMLHYLLQKMLKPSSVLILDDFRFLTNFQVFDNRLEQLFHLEHNAELQIDSTQVTPRRVLHMLEDIELALKEKPEFLSHKRITIAYFFTKHLWPECYEQLDYQKDLDQCFSLIYQGKTYTLQELVSMVKGLHRKGDEKAVDDAASNFTDLDFQALFADEHNRDMISILQMFQWNYDLDEIPKQWDALVNKPLRYMTQQNQNEQINHLIRYLSYCGKSEYSDSAFAIKDFKNHVLKCPPEKQESCFETFYQKWFDEEIEKHDNRTIDRVGMPFLLCLIQAFQVVGATTEEWLMMADFLIPKAAKTDKINMLLVECLNYFDLQDKEVYLKIISQWNDFQAPGNMNQSRAYGNFLMHYLGALSLLGYCDTEEVSLLRQSDSQKIIETIPSAPEYIIQPLIQKLKKEKAIIHLAAAEIELDTIIQFLEKNAAIIAQPEQLPDNKPRIKMEFSSRTKNHAEVERLYEIQTSKPDAFEKELEKSFRDGKISMYEVCRLRERTAAKG